jgi:hypothetical protein
VATVQWVVGKGSLLMFATMRTQRTSDLGPAAMVVLEVLGMLRPRKVGGFVAYYPQTPTTR